MNKIKQTLIIAFTLLFNLTYSQQKSETELAVYFDKFLSEQFKADEPGITALVSRNGQIIYKKAFGMANLELNAPMQIDNVFWIASMGKQFTATAILQLVERGKLKLNDEITKFIPDYPTQGNKITIEHLLTHTSGIHNFSGIKDPEKKLAFDCTPNEVIDFFKNLPMKFAPGTKWEYSNSGFFLLGYIIEKVTGKSYGEYLEENLLKPAGMSNSLFASNKKIVKNRVGSYSVGETGFENSRSLNRTHIYSAGAIQSTVEDLFKWHQAVHSYKLVKKEIMDKAFTRYKLNDGKEVDYGYGWKLGYVYEYPSIYHGGGIEGFGTMEVYLPKEDVFVVVFANCDCIHPTDIAFRIAAVAAGRPTDYKEVPIESSSLKEYAGLYENQKGQQRIVTVSENQLFSQLGRGPKSSLKSFKKDHFYFDTDPMQTIEFVRGKKGVVEKIVMGKLSGNDTWVKTNKPLPSENGIKVNEKILESYAGEYEIPHLMAFKLVKEQDKLYLLAGDDKIEMFADTETKFFLKVNDAQFEFFKGDQGKITKVILNQGGKEAEAKKVN